LHTQHRISTNSDRWFPGSLNTSAMPRDAWSILHSVSYKGAAIRLNSARWRQGGRRGLAA